MKKEEILERFKTKFQSMCQAELGNYLKERGIKVLEYTESGAGSVNFVGCAKSGEEIVLEALVETSKISDFSYLEDYLYYNDIIADEEEENNGGYAEKFKCA